MTLVSEEVVSTAQVAAGNQNWFTRIYGESADYFDLRQWALAETERCFSCGTCIECDNCVHYCPDLAVKHEAGGYVVLTDYCKGCGLCVEECPRGSLHMVSER